jgi:2-amino-4-hydroxy-6-hydroxymethyldihydropteridine diphosphokinase
MATVYLGLGSNLGNRARNIYHALRLLGSGVRLGKISSLYDTEPVGLVDQPHFLNLVCCGETDLSPEALLDLAKTIEREMGREPGVRFGPRVIDVDILLFDDLILSTPQLEIPHPRLHKRAFVLIPLSEVAPGLTHPLLNRGMEQLLENVARPEGVRTYPLKDS